MKGPVFTVLTLLILFTAACSKEKAVVSHSLDGNYRLVSVFLGWGGETLKKNQYITLGLGKDSSFFTHYNFQPGDKGRYSIRIIPQPGWIDTVIYFIHPAGDTITRYKRTANDRLYLDDGNMDGVVETYVKIGG